MAGTYPTTPEFASVGFSSEQKTITTTTDSGKMFSVQVDGQRFKFSASYPPMNRSEFAPVYAFIMKQRSQKETFQISLPDLKNAKGDVAGLISTDGNHTAGDTTIDIQGITNGTTLKAGDMIKFNAHTKVYMVVEDATGDVSDTATITIEPPLREDVLSGDTILYDNVPFTVRLTNDVQEFSTNDLDLYRFEIDFIEAL
jgi:hypothetical protein